MVEAAGRLRTLLTPAESRNKARISRENADRARDNADWHKAADLYRAYLRVYPNKPDIWIQLGNMHKEALQYTAAAAAYQRAILLNPGDAEPHVQIGHLRKRQGLLDLAARHYVDAVAINPRSSAGTELRHPDIVAHLGQKGRAINEGLQKLVLGELQQLCEGLTVTAAQSIDVIQDEGVLRFLDDDPWIEFTLQHDRRARFGLLAFQIVWPEAVEDSRPEHNQFYVDYGQGYTEQFTLKVSREDGWISELLLAAPETIRSIRWDPAIRPTTMKLDGISYRPLVDVAEVDRWLANTSIPAQEGDLGRPDFAAFALQKDLSLKDVVAMQYELPAGYDRGYNYQHWHERYIEPKPQDIAIMTAMAREFALKPKFSFVMPVYNPPVELLRECIDSMLAQTYEDFEICIADDCSPNPEIRKLLTEYSAKDDRVKVDFRRRNGHISAASNSALALATGEYVVLVDHDDLIPNFALFVIAFYINKFPNSKVLFSDEDKINTDGKIYDPYFKGEFNKFLMFGHNMISHIGVYRKDIVDRVGGFRLGLEGSQDYDLFLRCYEVIAHEDVVHIPHVLYHWRAIPGSTAVSADQKSYAIFAAQGAINGYFERNAIPWRSVDGFGPGCTAVVATAAYDTPMSIIIPTRDGLDVLRPCVESIFATKPENIEIIIVDNQSHDPETFEYFDYLADEFGVKIVKFDDDFNFSSINNLAAEHATGDILCFLNNDVEVISKQWLDRARALMALPDVGMVGARLLFPDGGVQHMGIALGLGGDRIAGTPHGGYPAHYPGYFGKSRLIQEFSAVTAACMFVGKSDFHRIGGFDPELRVAYNDVDLCLRLRQTGLRIVCDPDIELIHKESKTRGSDRRGERAKRLRHEAALMRERWGGALLDDPYYSPNISLSRSDFALAYPPRVRLPWQNVDAVKSLKSPMVAEATI